MSTNNNAQPQDNYTEVLQHRIKWWLRDNDNMAAPTELDDSSVEHIDKSIRDNFREGELHVSCVDDHGDSHEFSGWWSIDN